MPPAEKFETHAATPGEKRAIVRGMFDRIAPTYDLLNHLLSLGIDRRWRRKTVDLMRVREGAVILDLACGTGDLSEEAARRDATAIFAVDPSHKMLLRARAKMQYRLTICNLAKPTFTRSRKATRYSKDRKGTSLRATLR